MSEKERRRTPRIKCRFRCQIDSAAGRGEGLVMDMSEGGLCVRTELPVEHGETVFIAFEMPKQRDPIQLEALAWHARGFKEKKSGKPFVMLGLMLVNVPDSYIELLPTTKPSKPIVRGTAAVPAAKAVKPREKPRSKPTDGGAASKVRAEAKPSPPKSRSPETPPKQDRAAPQTQTEAPARDDQPDPSRPIEGAVDLTAYRIRVKARQENRTRILSLGASSVEEARALAADQLECEWEILEVWQA